MTKRATIEQVKEFANAVREAGGGNPLDALMPAVPEDSTACLIAKNLNFNCEVDGGIEAERWAMWVHDPAVRDRIAEKLNLERVERGAAADEFGDSGYGGSCYGVVLPPEIGQVAVDFDRAGRAYAELEYYMDDHYEDEACEVARNSLTKEDLELLRELGPYIDMSEDEARSLATVVNPDGSIVV